MRTRPKANLGPILTKFENVQPEIWLATSTKILLSQRESATEVVTVVRMGCGLLYLGSQSHTWSASSHKLGNPGCMVMFCHIEKLLKNNLKKFSNLFFDHKKSLVGAKSQISQSLGLPNFCWGTCMPGKAVVAEGHQEDLEGQGAGPPPSWLVLQLNSQYLQMQIQIPKDMARPVPKSVYTALSSRRLLDGMSKYFLLEIIFSVRLSIISLLLRHPRWRHRWRATPSLPPSGWTRGNCSAEKLNLMKSTWHTAVLHFWHLPFGDEKERGGVGRCQQAFCPGSCSWA